MSKRRLNITEALELFKNLPSDDESDELSESDAEDFISEHSDSSQKSDDDDANIDDINLPGPSRISKVLWRNKGSEKKRNMGFVDHFDQLKSMYEIDRKSKKWWHRIFFYFLDVTVVNSYILYSMVHDEKNPYYNNMKNFRLDLITALVLMGHQKQPEKRLSSPKISPKPYSGPVKLKFRKHKVSEKERLKSVGHIPQKCKSRRCAYCSTTNKPHRTSWMCPNCDVGLCMIVKGNDKATCFQKFHGDWK